VYTPLDQVLDDQIRKAEQITAVDPNDIQYRKTIYSTTAMGRLPTSSPRTISYLAVALDSKDPAQLDQLRSRVRSVKGVVTG
jgi:hypothetical protein